jgi:hypothetical protein
MKSHFSLLFVLLSAMPMADPQLTSWQTEYSCRHARIYQTSAAEAARTTSTTWSKGAGVQSAPTYAGVSQVAYSAKTYCIPRNPVIPATKSLTALGASGCMVIPANAPTGLQTIVVTFPGPTYTMTGTFTIN